MIEYLKRLVRTWATWVFAAADLVAFIVDSSRSEIAVPPYAYWAIAAVGFGAANYMLFSDLARENAQLRQQLEAGNSEAAEIHLSLVSSSFNHRAPILIFSDRFADGLRPGGLPIEAYIYARVEMENRGFEAGTLNCSLDLEASDLPDVFVLREKTKDGEFEGLAGQLAARSRSSFWWRLDLAVAEREPDEFAAALREARQYHIVLMYHTRRIGGASPQRTLAIRGDFDDYRMKLRELWTAAGHIQLASRIQHLS
jgi:hypothetical protein